MTKNYKATALPVPDSYAFDDTPKAFKRMLQRKQQQELNGYSKNHENHENHENRENRKSSEATSENRKSPVNVNHKSPVNYNLSANNNSSVNTGSIKTASPAAGFKNVRAKRKAHLQARDLKKKLKRFDTQLDLPHHSTSSTARRRDVRDIVQEPPKLHRPKKVFKKVKDERDELKSWSDYEDETQ